MRYRTHLATTFAVSLPLMVSTDALSVGSVSMLALGAVFPDIDEPNSYIGRRLNGISKSFKILFGHRGMTHSIVGWLAAAFILYTIHISFSLPIELVYWFSAGYLAHLVEDSFSKNGIAWLQPLTKKRFQSGFKIIYYTTGSLIENLIFVGSVLWVLHEILQLNLSEFTVRHIQQLW